MSQDPIPASNGKPGYGRTVVQAGWWRQAVGEALKKGAQTPFYLFSPGFVQERLDQLESLDLGRPVRHWYSCKTQPLAAQMDWWRRAGRGIEVVSEAEYRLARACGFDVDHILINGPAKHRWLPSVSETGLRVNFDSPNELAALLPLARKDQWRTGIRLLTAEEMDPGQPEHPTQFGFSPAEAMRALKQLKLAGLPAQTLHFHLRTNLETADAQARALATVAEVCSQARFQPRFLDIGGGLPPSHTRSLTCQFINAHFRFTAWAAVLRRTWDLLPMTEELWLENGRFLLAGSGVLCIRILDIKQRGGLRQLIADGGRTLNALISTWEDHELIPLISRGGRTVKTAVYGPTCMAFDQLPIRSMSGSLRVGDCLLWMDAGAYHLPWETCFSHPLAEIWWKEGDALRRERPPGFR